MFIQLVLVFFVFTEVEQKAEETDYLVEFCGKANIIGKKIKYS